MTHIFLDETKSAGPITLLALVGINDENKQKLSQILALPDKSAFNEDAYNLLYRLENNELKNPEYAFRRIQRAYFSPFSFSKQICDKVNKVLEELSSLEFTVILSIYDPKVGEKVNLSHPQLKNYHTRNILAYYVSEYPQELSRTSIVQADHGFYPSTKLHIIKSTFRGPLKVGVCEEGSPALRYTHLVDKKIDICSSYDSKGIQLADIVAGIAGRTIYKPYQSEPFYSAIKDQIAVLLDNRRHMPARFGDLLNPSPINSHLGAVLHRPDLTKIRA